MRSFSFSREAGRLIADRKTAHSEKARKIVSGFWELRRKARNLRILDRINRMNRNHVLLFRIKSRTESLRTQCRIRIVMLRPERSHWHCRIQPFELIGPFLSFIRKLRKDPPNPVNPVKMLSLCPNNISALGACERYTAFRAFVIFILSPLLFV